MDIVKISLSKIERNTGQVEGLPSNPRQWTQSDVDRIAASLEQTPELFEARPLIVYPHDKKYIILGGNLRYTGAQKLKWKEVPAIVMPVDTPAEKLREIVIKDNGSFGSWDIDLLANEWDDPLVDWGVPAWLMDEADESAVDALYEDGEAKKEKEPSITISVPMQYLDIIDDIKKSLEITLSEWAGCKVK